MKQAMKTAMKDSIFEVFETMLYMPLELCEDSDFDQFINENRDNLVCCKQNFKGKITGYFLLFMPEFILSLVTQNFLGFDSCLIEKELFLETIKEIENIIVGNIFSRFEKKSIFDLGFPEIIKYHEINENAKDNEEDLVVMLKSMKGLFAMQITYVKN